MGWDEDHERAALVMGQAHREFVRDQARRAIAITAEVAAAIRREAIEMAARCKAEADAERGRIRASMLAEARQARAEMLGFSGLPRRSHAGPFSNLVIHAGARPLS